MVSHFCDYIKANELYTLGQLCGMNHISIELFKPNKNDIEDVNVINHPDLIDIKKTLHNIYTTFPLYHTRVLYICYVFEAKIDLETIWMTKTHSLVTRSWEYIAVVLSEGFWMLVGTLLVALQGTSSI